MNYLISYWLNPEVPRRRADELRRYFDLQCYLKQQFGAQQTIITNLDYEGAIPFIEPQGFSKEYAFFAKQFGLGQLLERGYALPVAVHDHDLFIRQPLPHQHDAILCGSQFDGLFSDQLVVYPEIARKQIMEYVMYLREFNFPKALQHGYGCKTRHESLYSSEVTMTKLEKNPYADIPIKTAISVHDLVSHNIVDHHSLDEAECEYIPIEAAIQAVHGHLNKGPSTKALIDWLALPQDS